MPIHFRCTACNRMLSIARRKAGTQVGCPKCGRKVSVPVLSGMAVASDPHAGGKPIEELPLFEQFNFEELLQTNSVRSRDSVESRPVRPAVATPEPEPEATADVLEVDGLLISRKQLMAVGVGIGVLLTMAFALGYLLAVVVSRQKAAG